MIARLLSRFSSHMAAAFVLVWLAAPSIGRADTIVYNSIVSIVGSQANGGATSATGNTTLLADDIVFAAGYAGFKVTSFTLAVSNGSTTESANLTAEFFATDGPNNGPGTLLGTVAMNNVTFLNGQTMETFTGANLFTIPANGQIWAGFYFTGVSGSLTALNSLGAYTETGGTVGSSNSATFFTGTGTATTGSNPSGSIVANPNGGQPANLGIAFAVPEPSSVLLTVIGGAGLAGLIVRRRKTGTRASGA